MSVSTNIQFALAANELHMLDFSLELLSESFSPGENLHPELQQV